jgi:glucose uptake protein GlcU
MADTRSMTSILGIIALILVIIAAVYFIANETDDNAIEIDIGFVEQGAPTPVA